MKKLLTILLLIFCSRLYAQQKTVTGTVTQKDLGTPLAGATVKAGSNAVSTDVHGKFTIIAPVNSQLSISFVGLQTYFYTVTNSNEPISVLMEYTSGSLDEVVVTGYQSQRKADLTGAVSVVNMTDIKDIPEGSATKALQGRIPGVSISTDGSPEANATVRIRGIGTLNNNDPLYVIDGIPTTRGLQEINQDDISSIQVLKDAASAAIYGSRAANGVIIVTTKKGKNGVHIIDVNASSSVQYYGKKLPLLNTEQRGVANWQASVNDKVNPDNQTYTYDWNNDFNNPVLYKVNIPEFIDPAKTLRSANTNWQDEISQTSLLQNYNLSITNGTDKGNSFFSLGYYDNTGTVKETHDQKITARFNSDYNFFNGRLKIGQNFNATYIKDRLIPYSTALSTALVLQPIVPVYTVTGGFGGPSPGMSDVKNPIEEIEDNKQNYSYFGRLFGNAFADLTIIPGLHFRTNYGVDYDGTYERTLRKSYVTGFLSDPSNLVNNSQNYDGNLIWQNTFTYDVSLNKNKLTLLAGQESIHYINQNFFASRQGYALEDINYAYLDAGSTNINNGGNGGAYSLLSYFAKADYSYDNKYLVNLTIRRDGSSRFGSNNQYGTFPSVSGAWRLSQEDFIKKYSFISDLKLRAGYGETGNQTSPNYASYTLYSAIYATDPTFNADRGTAYDITGAGTGTLPSGFVKTQQGNDNLKWETTKESDFGLDFGLFNQKISGSVDYFIKNTTGILITPGYLAVIGEGGSTTFNGGSLRNNGIEAIVNYNGQISKDISFEVSANISSYRNVVTYLPSDVLTAYAGNGSTQTILGHSINSIYGYVTQGLFTSQDEVTNSAAQPGKALGRIRYKDLNGDGTIDDKDQTFISNGDPNYTYGLNLAVRYKDFDLALFFQGVQGLTVYNGYKYATDFSSISPGVNWGTRVLDAWTPQNNKSTIPALSLVDNNNEGRTSTYFLENGSYMKLRNFQIGYDLKTAFKAIKVQKARVYIQGSNLFTVKSKSYTGVDPENPSNGYPIPTITSIGLDLTF